MTTRFFSLCLFCLLLGGPRTAFASDSPETLAWVQRVGAKIENTLEDAVNANDWANLLVKLMEAHDDFDAIALAGLQCQDARIAAELGRNYCNWLNNYTKDKDLNACIVRAQEGRKQAHMMVEAAAVCQNGATTRVAPSEPVNSLSSVVLAETDAIRQHLQKAQNALSHHSCFYQLEQAYRLFVDLGHFSSTLKNCATTHSAASKGANECLLALLSKTEQECALHIAQALDQLQVLEKDANVCR
jgi:hypothetical protein